MEMEASKYFIEEPKPLILIISGLSGSGKDTVINRLKEISTVDFHFVVTCNTRRKREGEIDGKDYHFITREKFLEMIENGEMLEHSEVYDDLKGVPRFEIEKALHNGKDMILRLDYQGMRKVKAVYPEAVSVFIIPPDADAWIARLRARNTDSEESLMVRIRTAVSELEHINDFDYVLVNDEIDHAAMDLLTPLGYRSVLAAASLDHVQVTLESVDPEIHDAMVGTKGAWNETVAGIKTAVRHHIHINTNTTLLTHNASVEAINRLSDFLAELGVMTFGLNALICSGKGKEVDSAIHTDRLQELLDAAKSAAERNGQRLLWYTPTQYCHFDPVTTGVGYKSCSAAKYSMCIEPDGNVLPCQSWYEPVGNILTDEWNAIWNHPLCLRLRNKEYMPALCGECSSRDLCTCGCPLEAERNGADIHPRIVFPDCF